MKMAGHALIHSNPILTASIVWCKEESREVRSLVMPGGKHAARTDSSVI